METPTGSAPAFDLRTDQSNEPLATRRNVGSSHFAPTCRSTGCGYEAGSFFGKTEGFFVFYSFALCKLCDPRNLRNGQFSGTACPRNSRKSGCRFSSSYSIYILRGAPRQRFMLIDLLSLQPGVCGLRQASLPFFFSFFPSFSSFIRKPRCP